ncbi:MAG: hypothetical protein IPH10_10835 [bacterium]|nr:hypothetical protein [bacterium]
MQSEAEWMENMLPIAKEFAHYYSTDPAKADDMSADALVHLLAVHRTSPDRNLIEKEGYCRKVLQNKIRTSAESRSVAWFGWSG